MNQVTIEIDSGQTAFRPGDAVRGQIEWLVDSAPEKIEVRLLWSTSGKGMQDLRIEDSIRIESSRVRDRRPFELHAPEQPYSFSGRLVSLVWAVEAVIEPNLASARMEIVIAPGGVEVDLYANGEPEKR